MTTFVQGFQGEKRGTFVILVVETDMDVESMESKYRSEYGNLFKYYHRLKTTFVSAAILSNMELRPNKRGEVPGEDLFTALANTFHLPGISSIVEPRKIKCMKSFMWDLKMGKRKMTRELWHTCVVEHYPEDMNERAFKYPSKQTWESTTTFDECDKAHQGHNGKKDPFTYQYPLGHGFVLVGIQSNEQNLASDRFRYSSTVPLTAQEINNLQKVVIERLSTHIIPQMGRSVFKDTISRFGYKQSPVISKETGKKVYVKDTCPEVRPDGHICGGHYLPTPQGEFACEECGIIYEYNDVFVRRLKQGISNVAPHMVKDDEFDDEETSSDDIAYTDLDTRREDHEVMEARRAQMIQDGQAPKGNLFAGDDDLPSIPVENIVEVDEIEVEEEVEEDVPEIELIPIVSTKEPVPYTSDGMEYYEFEVQSEFEGPNVLEDMRPPIEKDIGDTLPPSMRSFDKALEEKLVAWKVMLTIVPGDEARVHDQIRKAVEEHRKAVKAARNAKLASERKSHAMEGTSIYMRRWQKKAQTLTDYRIRQIIRQNSPITQAEIIRIFDARNDGTRVDNTKRTITFYPLAQEQVRRSIIRLAEKGHIIKKDNGATSPRAKVVTVTYVDTAPERQVPVKTVYTMPTLKNRLVVTSQAPLSVAYTKVKPSWVPGVDANGRHTVVKKDEFKSSAFPMEK